MLVHCVDIHPPRSRSQSRAESQGLSEETQSLGWQEGDSQDDMALCDKSVVETGTGALRAEGGLGSPQRP